MLCAAASLLLAAWIAGTTPTAQGAAVLEPADGTVYFGAWLNLSDDTPLAFNKRMGFNASSFQMSQNIPLDPFDYVTGSGGEIDETLLEATQTNASLFLTVYPTTTLDLINSTSLTLLGEQILGYQSAPYNRSVFLRYAPEMQGDWFVYGLAPTSFLSGWKTMYTTIKSIAPDTVIVWSPNNAFGYPWGYSLSQAATTADQTLLDTNGDGDYTSADDAYSPYYPGDDYVDWAGFSYYEKGLTYPYVNNVAMPNGSFETAWIGDNDTVVTPFYSTYCETPARPCVVSEAGAAFHVNTTEGDGIGQLALEQLWWLDSWANSTFFATYPLVKMVQLFEFAKVEEEEQRDYRITYNSTLLSAFTSSLLASVPSLYQSPIYQADSSSSSDGTNADASGSASSASSTCPSLFGGAAPSLRGVGWEMLLGAVVGVLGAVFCL
ncbi:hypothetical protein BCR35DRAFT_308942 [Leucosporidium creatinivorum]|uniref:GH26 domain-containing protein n=1 Tax=Leucosporidium creatinivorum TaxID=106004 RepID=A0A1Y2DTU2_9BASI|nr:hypothetical protein BCR35DRAFT_308942 [Leucosporidium creatinivorum]